MAWEKRGNGRYYYRKRREGGRIISKYVGTGPLAEATALLDSFDREEQEAWRREREEIEAIGQAGTEAEDLILTLTRAWLLSEGYHTHKGQWRRQRRHDESTTD